MSMHNIGLFGLLPEYVAGAVLCATKYC